jgi:hypothetical protein
MRASYTILVPKGRGHFKDPRKTLLKQVLHKLCVNWIHLAVGTAHWRPIVRLTFTFHKRDGDFLRN